MTEGPQNRPNVVLIVVDQWRGDALSAAGHPVVRTPYLDALADRGTRFTNAYSASPTCVPARTTMLTGLKASTHGRVGYEDGVDFDISTTLPGEFSAAGYHTQAIGKMHVWPERARAGFDDVILHDGYLHHSRRRERDPQSYDDYLSWLRAQGGESAVADYLEDGLHCNSMVARPWPSDERLHPSNWIVTEATRWLYRRDPTVPFFLKLSFHRPHPPYDPPRWAFDQNMAALEGADPPPEGDWTADFDEVRNDNRPDSHVAVYPPESVKRARAGYYGNMVHIDQQIDRFLEVLGEFGLAETTIVCFTSDHGEMMGDHRMWRKGYPYEGSAKVPFLLSGPGLPAQGIVEDVVELMDVMPTLLDCAGLPVPAGIDGSSVLPLLKTERADHQWRPYVHGEHVIFGQSLHWIRQASVKYIWMSGNGREQLFDLAEDPHELRNLADHPAYTDCLKECRSLLISELTDREEGFVNAGQLVAGRPVSTTLPGAGSGRGNVERVNPVNPRD